MPQALKLSPQRFPQTLQFERIDRLDRLEALEGEWNALFARVRDPRLGFQSHAWTAAWARHYGGASKLSVLTARADGVLRLAWPLVERKSFGVTTLENLGEPVCQYHGAVAEGAALGALIDRLKGQGCDLLRLRRVRGDSRLAELLLARGAAKIRVAGAPFVDLVNGKLVRGEGERGKSASNRRRRLKKLEALGSVQFELAQCPHVAKARLEAAMALKRAWAMKSGRLARAAFDRRFEAVFEQALAGRDPFSHLRVYSLLVGDRVAGVEISVVCRGRLFGHLLAHDPELSAYGIGAALAEASIRAACAEGHQVFDLLAPADPYKRAYADGEVDVFDLQLALTRRGFWLGRARTLADRMLRAIADRAPALIVREALARLRRSSRH